MSTVNRITGFSGIDVESMVKSLMTAKRVPLNQLNQKKQVLEWQRDDFRSMNTKILDFRNQAFSMKLQSPYAAKKGSSSDTNVVDVKAGVNAIAGNYTFKVTQLASTSSTSSTSAVGASAKGAATKLSDLGVTEDQTITVNGDKGSVTVKVVSSGTISDLVGSINSQSGKTGVSVSYDEGMDRFFLNSTGTGTLTKISLSGAPLTGSGTKVLSGIMKLTTGTTTNVETMTGTPTYDDTNALIKSTLASAQKVKFNYDGKFVELTINANTTVGQVISQINNSDIGKLGVSAYLDGNKHLVLFNPDTTSSRHITVTNSDADSYDVAADFAFGTAVPAAAAYERVAVTNGQDALVKFNGVTGTYHSNTMTINGIEFTAKKAQNVDDTIALPVNIAVSTDVDSIFNSIKGFIDKYNDTIGSLNSELKEERYRDFLPLTDEQRSQLKDDEIKKWEDKAKSGLLRNDFIFSSAINEFRSDMINTVSGLSVGDINRLSDIGIGTTSYTDQGKLTINEDKLRQAITESPDQVMKLFTANDDSTSDAGHGLAVRLYDAADVVWKRINTKAGTSTSAITDYDIGKDINSINKRIDVMNENLKRAEDQYYRQFSAMESAMTKYQSQSSYFASFLNGGGNQ